MPPFLCCPNGHRFVAATSAVGEAIPCPECGTPWVPDAPTHSTALPSTHADDPEATGPYEPTTAPEEQSPPAEPPGYEILRSLGQGGMGTVYLARQIGFNRLVALKMIRAADQASPRDRLRFQTEAESIARLSHAHIVQVFEVGEFAGQPFYSMEHCGGGSLRERLREHPLTPTEAASLVSRLAGAMEAAHRAGVIHRDLKPANVLLTADGTPRIADFGLAKKLDDQGQTVPGAILGTPSYMAPEQARGDTDLGPAVDVYALGAILYECLTGRPPFKAATLWETVGQVLNSEVVSPRQLNSKVPLDLETICLKCLQKDRLRRYASASALADDLGRFLAVQPIQARPVGSVERATKWVRRNPVVAVLSAAVVLLLVTGTAVSTTLAILAWQRANDLTNANLEIRQREEKVLDSNRRLRESLVVGWYGPLGQTEPRVIGGSNPLTSSEVNALQQIAESREPGLGELLVRVALAREARARQLMRRADHVLHAAVGLDETERATVERLLLQELTRSGRSRPEQANFAFALARLGGLSDEARRVTLEHLIREMNGWGNLSQILATRSMLHAVLAPLPEADTRELVALLLPAMASPEQPGVRAFQAHTLLTLAERLPEAEARPLYPTAVRAVLRQTLEGDRPIVALPHSVLATALPHLTDAEVSEAARMLRQGLDRWQERRSSLDLRAWGESVRVLVPRLAPIDAEDLASVLVVKMAVTTDGSTLGHLAAPLLDLAPGLTEATARRLVDPLGQPVVAVGGLYPVGQRLTALRALLGRLGPMARRDLEPILLPRLAALPLEPDLHVRREVGRCVVLLIEPLPHEEAQARIVALTRRLTARTFLTFDYGPGLAALFGPFLPAEEARRLVELLLTDPGTADRDGMTREALALLKRVPTEAIPGVVDLAEKQIDRAADPRALLPALTVASAALEGLDPDRSAARWSPLGQAVFRRLAEFAALSLTIGDLAEFHQALARFPRSERGRFARQMAAALHPSRPGSGGRLATFLRQIGDLVPTLAPVDVEKVAERLMANLEAEQPGWSTVQQLLPCWEALTVRLSAARNARLAGRLLDDLRRHGRAGILIHHDVLSRLMDHGGVAGRALAPQVIALLRAELKTTPGASMRYNFIVQMVPHLERLDATTARTIARETMADIHRAIPASPPGGYDRRVLSFALVRLLPFLESAEQRAELEALTDRLTTTLKNAADSKQLDEPTYLLEAIAALLPEERAAALAGDLCRGGLEPALVARLMRGLLAGLPRPDTARSVAGLVGGVMVGTPYLGLAQTLPPFRLGDNNLLAILAEPLCVGEPRRAVLEVLEQRHRRRFIDHWEAARYLRR